MFGRDPIGFPRPYPPPPNLIMLGWGLFGPFLSIAPPYLHPYSTPKINLNKSYKTHHLHMINHNLTKKKERKKKKGNKQNTFNSNLPNIE